MSRAPYWLPGLRWGQRMNDGVAIDPMTGALSDPFDGCHMGVTAENVAADYGVSRADQDALAAESHRRAAAADHGRRTSRSRSSRSRSPARRARSPSSTPTSTSAPT